ncbi:MAG TPA: hypothetical protein VL475_15605 [Planctomycetaceae bacterium]|jgi:hypothetical protein|nr:hypothetical protein [Planctomycetaceae bacterium]
MDERPTKRRGPIGWLKGRSRRFWIVFAILLPPLYLLASGPTRPLAFRNRLTYVTRPGTSRRVAMATSEQSALWVIAFAPLEWAAKEPWGRPIKSYWALFPIQTVVEDQ